MELPLAIRMACQEAHPVAAVREDRALRAHQEPGQAMGLAWDGQAVAASSELGEGTGQAPLAATLHPAVAAEARRRSHNRCQNFRRRLAS